MNIILAAWAGTLAFAACMVVAGSLRNGCHLVGLLTGALASALSAICWHLAGG